MFFGAIFGSMKPINLPRQARDKHKARNVEAKKALFLSFPYVRPEPVLVKC